MRRGKGCRRTGPAAPSSNRRRAVAGGSCAGLDQLVFGGDEMQRRIVVPLHHHRRILDDLRGMDGRRDRRFLVDETEFAENALLEIGEAGAFAGSAAAPRHRDAADDAEIELRHFLEADRLAVLQKALRGRGGLEIDALGGELFGIDAQIGKALGQVGHRREQQLAVVERAQPHRDLRRIGIAFHDARALPGVEFAQAAWRPRRRRRNSGCGRRRARR